MEHIPQKNLYRDYFEIPSHIVYLNAAFLSPQMKGGEEILAQCISSRKQPWLFKSEDFFKDCETLRALSAKLFGASKDHIALVPSVSFGVETAVKNLQVPKDKEVLYPQGEFPSNVYPWREKNKDGSFLLKEVVKNKNQTWTQAFIENISHKTAVVSVPQVHWSDGSYFELTEISAKAKSVGAALIVDLSQSLGIIPCSIQNFDPDFAFSVGYKWQLGPYGLSYLYVPKRHWDKSPLDNNWLNRKDSHDFCRLSTYQDAFLEGARKFDSGQHGQFALVPLAIQALSKLNEWGTNKIYEDIRSLNSYLRTLLGKYSGLLPEQCGHFGGIQVGSSELAIELCHKLKEKNIYTSAREKGLRIAPHVYNTEEDIEKLALELAKLLDSKIRFYQKDTTLAV